MSELSGLPLTLGARRLVEDALEKVKWHPGAKLGVNHWLLALVERHGAMAESLAESLSASEARRRLHKEVAAKRFGDPLPRDRVVLQAVDLAEKRGKQKAAERDLARAILAEAGFEVSAQEEPAEPRARKEPEHTVRGEGGGRSETPTLDQYGRELTAQAKEGKLSPVVGRESEISLVIETLARRTKRNPVLVGPAGVGKTAIVEGLAQAIVDDDVPDTLKGVRLFAVQPSTLVAGSQMRGDFEKRMKSLLQEASQEDIVLFIDEVHSLIGAGGMMGTGDAASLLKPALSRGELACIAATTDEEYRRFIEPDPALERRFQPVRVQELGPDHTMLVLRALRDDLTKLRKVAVPDAVLQWLVEFADQYLRNRHFPDKGVDLLEQCVAYAVTKEKPVVEQDDAEAVAQRLVGMPPSVDAGLASLREALTVRRLLRRDDVEAVVNRVAVTMRGLDVRPLRPNAVVLLLERAAENIEALAETVAEALFGSSDRVVTIDFGRFTNHADITMLIGAPPGYVGYSEQLPIHELLQTPWCVARFENVDACHPHVRELLTQALDAGFFTDAQGRRVYLSEAVVLLTASSPVARKRTSVGFRPASADEEEESDVDREELEKEMERHLGGELASQIDRICVDVPTGAEGKRVWLEQHLLAELAQRYGKRGVEVAWEESVVEWLLRQHGALQSEREWERLVDERISPRIIPLIPPSRDGRVKVRVSYHGTEGIRAEPQTESKE